MWEVHGCNSAPCFTSHFQPLCNGVWPSDNIMGTQFRSPFILEVQSLDDGGLLPISQQNQLPCIIVNIKRGRKTNIDWCSLKNRCWDWIFKKFAFFFQAFSPQSCVSTHTPYSHIGAVADQSTHLEHCLGLTEKYSKNDKLNNVDSFKKKPTEILTELQNLWVYWKSQFLAQISRHSELWHKNWTTANPLPASTALFLAILSCLWGCQVCLFQPRVTALS